MCSEVVIPCADETTAREEAARQQAIEREGAEWIYLRIDGRWCAKRYVAADDSNAKEKGRVRRTIGTVLGEMLDPFNWSQ